MDVNIKRIITGPHSEDIILYFKCSASGGDTQRTFEGVNTNTEWVSAKMAG